MKPKTILSLEQALTLPYATQRFVQLGWRVIRIESNSFGGDPNRYIGNNIGFDDVHSYFVAPNVGKEAITLNLKAKEGQALLKKIIHELKVDIFMCNTLPVRYKQLGIDFDSLKEANPNIIWCGISAMGPDYPDVAGYDPALQAMLGFMHLTGEADRDPLLCGLPIVDLKAGDEAFAQVLLALAEQRDTSGGKEIFISMTQCLATWLITTLPELALNPDDKDKFTRCGNEHRSFIPCNCYPTKDGYIYIAIGSDQQWEKFCHIPGFEHAATPERKTNAGRKKEKDNIYEDIRQGASNYTTEALLEICREHNLVVAPINTVKDVATQEFVTKNFIKMQLPSGEQANLFPAPINTDFLDSKNMTLEFPPHLGEHNSKILHEVGLNDSEIEELKIRGII
ncbi:MAG: CoA-transferase protein [Ignavibacteria bacterium]|nr:CoA-transferase protein [Ignavibacteria bacterium]